MSVPKRPRDEDAHSYDIRALFTRARVREALRRSGPFFLERILFPRPVPAHCGVGGALPDPTRVCRDGGPKAFRNYGRLALPHRTGNIVWLQQYERLQHSALRTVVSAGLSISPRSVVADIVFDKQEQFAVVCQPKSLAVHSTEEWLEIRGRGGATENSTPPLVKVEARGVQRLGFGFSAVQFLSSSLHLVAGYHQAPFVDIFDLEDVDEETCEPQQRFALTENQMRGHTGSAAMYTEGAYANDIVAVTEHISLAALSSGLSVWMDRRSGKTTVCTGVFTREYNIGQNDSHRSMKGGPLTAVAFLCRDDPINVVCGTKTGAVQLWDVRCNRDYIASHQTGATVCRIHPTYASSRRSVVWLNTIAGEVQGVSVGQSDMCPIAAAKRPDTERSTETFHMPLPRLAVLDPPGLLACPHVSSNALLLYDIGVLGKMSSLFPEFHRTDTRRVDSWCPKSDPRDGSDDTTDDHDGGGLCALRHDSHGGGVVESIPVRTALSYKGRPNITSCAVWSKYGRLVMGDALGRVQLT